MEKSEVKNEERSNSKPKRRLRTDQNNRDFTCGCGKSYLSYPALYTHLKYFFQKHNGKAPNGTVLPSNVGPKGNRGRPKREDNNNDKDDEKSLSSNQPEETLEELLLFLDTLGYECRNDKKFDNWTQVQSFLVDNFPHNIIKDNIIFEILTGVLERRTLEEQEDNFIVENFIEEELEESDHLRHTYINKIFAYFLIDIGYKLSAQAYKEFVVYIHMFQRGLNELGYEAARIYEQELVNNVQQTIQKDQTKKFCENEKGERILIISNEFILNLLPKYFEELGTQKEKEFQIFGSSDVRLKNAVYVTQHLSYWLYAQKFSNSRLAIYSEDDDN